MAARSGWSLSMTGTDRRFHTAGLEPLIELCFAEADQSAHLVEGHPSLVHEATDVPLRDPEMDSGVADAQKDGMMLHRSHPPTSGRTKPNSGEDRSESFGRQHSAGRDLVHEPLVDTVARHITVNYRQPRTTKRGRRRPNCSELHQVNGAKQPVSC